MKNKETAKRQNIVNKMYVNNIYNLFDLTAVSDFVHLSFDMINEFYLLYLRFHISINAQSHKHARFLKVPF